MRSRPPPETTTRNLRTGASSWRVSTPRPTTSTSRSRGPSSGRSRARGGTQPWLIAAGVVAPPALIWFFLRWKRWLAGAPYAYRLLTSLGEDADNLLEERRQKMLREGMDPGEK